MIDPLKVNEVHVKRGAVRADCDLTVTLHIDGYASQLFEVSMEKAFWLVKQVEQVFIESQEEKRK